MNLIPGNEAEYSGENHMPSKYRNVPVTIDNIRFHSSGEGKRYLALRLLERAGEIYNLELQPKYPLIVNGIKCGSYIGDFRYMDMRNGCVVLEDWKGGPSTPVYRLKKRIVEAIYPGVRITEVRK